MVRTKLIITLRNDTSEEEYKSFMEKIVSDPTVIRVSFGSIAAERILHRVDEDSEEVDAGQK